MPMNEELKAVNAHQNQLIAQTADFMTQMNGDYTVGHFDSIGDENVPTGIVEVFDQCGGHAVMRKAIADGVRLGIQRYKNSNGGEMPSIGMVATGIGAASALFVKDDNDRTAFDNIFGFDSLSSMNHQALSIVPAMTTVTIATSISNSLAIVAMLPNGIGSNEVPIVYGRMIAGRTHGGLLKGDYLDGEKSTFGYLENRFKFKMELDSGTTYSVESHVSYADYAAKTPDLNSSKAPFLGGRVSVRVNGIEVAHDRSRTNSKQSGTTSLVPVQDVVIASTPVLVASGTANLDQHTISVTFANALPQGAIVHAAIVFDFERLDANEQPLIRPPSVDIDVEYHSIFASPARCQIKASVDAITQMSNELNVGFMGAALAMVQNRYYLEQTIRLLMEGKERALMNGRVHRFDASKGVTGNLAASFNNTGGLMAEINKTLQFGILKICQASGQSVTSLDLFVGDKASSLFKTMDSSVFIQAPTPTGGHNQIVRIGTMVASGINVYHVPSSSGLLAEGDTSAELLLVARSAEAAKSPFVGHMPVPPMIRTANPSEFTEQIGVYSRVCAEINPIGRYGDQIAVIEMTNLQRVS